MRKFLFIAALFFGCLTIKIADAQVGIHVSVNIGSQPAWGPVGYSHVQYYYMPDIDAYYDVPAHQYVYYENNVWIHDGNLPPRYSNFDRYHSYKVVVNQRNPWERDADFRNRYAVYRGRRDQQIIRDSRDDRYRNHWNGDDNRRHDNGNHYGQQRNDNHDRGDRGNGNGNGNGHDHGHGGGHDHGGDGGHDHGDH
ncbi:MAG: hypothetical protein JWQ63_2681 [Mucilaginibacter sp.]|jgi:hypothetical protein|nr:hypothetical protein [Mucilaginibacter sp.]